MRTIEIDVDGGELLGYVCEPGEENIPNYLSSYLQDEELSAQVRQFLSTRNGPVALLKSMFVDELCRNNGVGSELLSQFFEKAAHAGADAFLLIADVYEEQMSGFDLVSWYEKWDFSVAIDTDSSYPLMAHPLEFAEELQRLVPSPMAHAPKD